MPGLPSTSSRAEAGATAGVLEARSRLAVEEARRLAAARTDFLPPLLAARAAVGSAANGFLLPDLARWLARPLLLVGVLSATLTFLVAGRTAAALTPRTIRPAGRPAPGRSPPGSRPWTSRSTSPGRGSGRAGRRPASPARSRRPRRRCRST